MSDKVEDKEAYYVKCKYALTQDYTFFCGIVGNAVRTRWVVLDNDGWVTVKAGFVWDGCSGPTYDSANTMLAGLGHDALYWLMRHTSLLSKYWRRHADDHFDKVLKRSGMSVARRWYYHEAVKAFGGPSANPKNKRKIYSAR